MSQLPRRAALDPLDTDYQDWEEEGLPEDEDDGHKVQVDAISPKFDSLSPVDCSQEMRCMLPQKGLPLL